MHPELGREVEVGAIDRELRRLWAEDDARTNASLINLAVYTEELAALERNSAAVRELTREHACRALLIGIDREAAETSIRAWITAHCHLAHGHKSVCCEQIAFALTGRATGRLRNTVFAHLNADLPLVFFWQGALSPLFEERLYGLVDRFVFDSAGWSDSGAAFARIVEAAEHSPRLVVQDLEWTRSFQFRVSVAALFDDAQAQRLLGSIDAVEIRHHPRHRNAALQMLAWLAVQAGWREGLELELQTSRVNGGREGFAFEQAGGRAFVATLVAEEEDAAIQSLEIRAGDAGVAVRREAKSCHLMRESWHGDHRSGSRAPADPESDFGLLGEQLSRGGRNSLFARILPRFRALLDPARGS